MPIDCLEIARQALARPESILPTGADAEMDGSVIHTALDILNGAGARRFELHGKVTIGVWSEKDVPLIRWAIRALHGERVQVLNLEDPAVPEEERFGKPVIRGQLQFRNRSLDIPFDDRLRAKLMAVLNEMYAAESMGDVPSCHDNPNRCRACGFRVVCRDSLAPPIGPTAELAACSRAEAMAGRQARP
jgi:CRISPR/Cas system-associated exonuclease Cas4 (RecB family)